jgi:hypothetical protein
VATPTPPQKPVAPAAQKTTTALTTNETRALTQVPAYVPSGREGLEDMTKEDVLIPRLALAQALSPQVTEGDPAYITGLKVGDMFNSMTQEIYGREVFVQIIRKDPPRAMEFFPQDDGGGVKDPNVPLDDPRMQWGEDGEKPVATLFRDYIARILPSGEMIALSFKGSGIKVARALNGLLVLRNKPIYTGRYRFTTAVELKPKPHQVYKVANAEWCTPDQIEEGAAMYAAVKDLNLAEQVHRVAEPDPEEQGDTSFPPVPAPQGAGPDDPF